MYSVSSGNVSVSSEEFVGQSAVRGTAVTLLTFVSRSPIFWQSVSSAHVKSRVFQVQGDGLDLQVDSRRGEEDFVVAFLFSWRLGSGFL